jgi:hypothetical protein
VQAGGRQQAEATYWWVGSGQAAGRGHLLACRQGAGSTQRPNTVGRKGGRSRQDTDSEAGLNVSSRLQLVA